MLRSTVKTASDEDTLQRCAAIQGAADMQRKIDKLATQLAAFTDELSNLNPFLIADATVNKAMALHPNNKAGKKVVQDALRAAKQD
ncbi:hypothetical protein AtubIFM56815_007177 [Aspergillus tubingensis]|uniref:Uncharacterized protein n=1 Tax=Aspergillus tubingensis TaxID=5068 RepID=A0A9W6ALK6_ASPTU|nr:hypothetical protein AtubIFM54640_003781 [Aspergillus tubingensis]GLA82986.1 hypothetical protein AtubIFM56815_007177 [Aspergillus tubingensis]GLA94746.1 hypothetical protein AtubIFM57143_001737 [Aspergillus tubingensis]GLB13628.1 hypothetical protein AtubIFM61612_001040 [Aspergillus tubingensis]